MIEVVVLVVGGLALLVTFWWYYDMPWPAQTIQPTVQPFWVRGFTDQVKNRYVTTDMSLERFEHDLDIAFRIEEGDIPSGGFTDADGFPRYLVDGSGRLLASPPSIILPHWQERVTDAARSVMILPPGATVTELPKPVIEDPCVSNIRGEGSFWSEIARHA